MLNLLADLKARLGLTYPFISHDEAVIEAVSDRVAVLYFGSLVELHRAEDLFRATRHPNTNLLSESAPVVGRALVAPERYETELPHPLKPTKGYAFRARCAYASDICAIEVSELTPHDGKHPVACHHPIDYTALDRLKRPA